MVQKSVSRQEVEKIAEEYGCSYDEALNAYLKADNAFEDTVKDVLAGRGKAGNGKDLMTVFTPRQIKDHLDKYVIGQEDYKKRLAIAASYHFALVKARQDNEAFLQDSSVKRFRKKNTLIAGPSGSGKTYCVEVLGDLLNIPVHIVDATDYTEAGYVGKNAEDMVRELISMAPGESKREKAEFINRHGGLIFIDEIDKKAKEGNMVGIDVSREGFQRAVLKLIERKLVSIEDPNSPASQIQDLVDQQRGGADAAKKKKSLINTENILFILGGSFQRPHDAMETIVKKRLDNKSGRMKEDGSLTISGFMLEEAGPKKDHYRNYYKDANEDDYIRFGLIPELVGRAPIRTYVNALSKNDLVRIMTQTEDSILNQYKLEFKLFGIDIVFTPDAIEEVAERAEKKKTGARALVSEWETVLTDFQYELPGTNFSAFHVTGDICRKPQDGILKLLEKSPFVDFIGRFKNDYGLELKFTDDAVAFVEAYAGEHQLQMSEALNKLLAGAPALNYMHAAGEFTIEPHMLADEKYFDKMYVEWHKKQMEQNG